MAQRTMDDQRMMDQRISTFHLGRLSIGFSLVWLSLAMTSAPVWSQAFMPMDGAIGNGRFIEPPRGSMQQMKTATEAAAQERFADAVVILGDLLAREQVEVDDELSGQDFFIDSPADARTVPVVHKSFIAEARRLLSTMPVAALDTYELRYGAQARKLLSDAQDSRDWTQVALVKRKFFHTQAGREATQLLVQRSLADGQVGLAKRFINDLLSHPRLNDESRKSIESVKTSLVSAPSATDATRSDNENAAASDAAPTAQGAASKAYALQPRRLSAAKDFPYFATPNSDGATAGGQLPLASMRYDVDTFGIDRQERTLRQAVSQLTAIGELPPPSWLPIRVGNYVLMRNTEVLLGVDFKTGKRVWMAPLNGSEAPAPEPETPLEGLPDDEAGTELLRQRVWNDLPFGRITSDRRHVYLLGNLHALQIATLSPLMGFQGPTQTSNGANSLIAVDLATEGKLVWQRGGEYDTDGVSEGEFYLCPPLPVEGKLVDGQLFVLAERSGDLLLICLDPATGPKFGINNFWQLNQERSKPMRFVALLVPPWHIKTDC